MERFVIIHYYEIALKGKNRPFFENKLIENIKKILKNKDYDFIRKYQGRIILKLNKKSNEKIILRKLKKVFGIAYFVFAFKSDPDIQVLGKNILEIIKEKEFEDFKIETKRADKQFYLNSQQINEKIGAFIKEKLNKKVSLEKPKLTIFIEWLKDGAFFYFKKYKGLAGLPVGTSSKVISLISSGFDSPVASYLLMKRGCQIVFVHFYSYPQTSLASKEAVEKIVRILNKYQFYSKIYFIPFLDIQKKIVSNSPPSYRVIFYRRAMLRIAELIAKKEKALALVTGDSVGQVASQTLENIYAISEATTLPILRPLIGINKEEIINLSKKIGTFKISSFAVNDCCNLFIPTHPETKANLEEIKKIEAKFNIDNLLNIAFKNCIIKEIKNS